MMCSRGFKVGCACLLLMGFEGILPGEPLTNVTIRPGLGHSVELSWLTEEATVYSVQWSQVLPATRWRPLPPWTQWPLVGPEHTEAIEPGQARFFRVEAIQRGRVLESSLQQSYSLFQIQLILAFSGLDVGVTPAHSVDVYRIEYETLDPWLGGSRASGILLIPKAVSEPLPLVSYQHGTLFERTEAPSDPSSLERLVGVVAASTGYAVVMADYWGLGEGSTGLHAYAQTRVGATAVVDLLRAARGVLAGLDGVVLSGQLFLTGYSQGGQVTLAAQREIEERHADEFSITASAPMEGPYDLSGTMFDVMFSDNPYPSPEFFPYVLLSYNQLYEFFDDAAEVFLEPYATSLPPLFDGAHSGGEVAAAMPAIPSRILRPEVLAQVRSDPNHPWRVALRENDLLGWRPQSPTLLVHCGSDTTVPAANAIVAHQSFLAAGATQVERVDPDPAGDHATCLEPAARAALTWFESLR